MFSLDTQPHMRKAMACQQEHLPERVNSARMTVSDAPGDSRARGVSNDKLLAGILQRGNPHHHDIRVAVMTSRCRTADTM
jgi:hypothetical protein